MKWSKQFEIMNENMVKLTKSMEQLRNTQNNILTKLNLDDSILSKRESNDALGQWLCDGLKLSQYYDKFKEEGFDDISMISHLDNDDLLELGVHKMAHRKKILNAIKLLKKSFIPTEIYYILNNEKLKNVKMMSHNSDCK